MNSLINAGAAAASVTKKAVEGVADTGKKTAEAASQKAEDLACALLEDKVGAGAVEALKALAKTMGDLYKDLFPEPPRYPCILNLCMMLGQVVQESRYKSPLVSGVAWTDTDVLKKGARFAKFANAVYRSTKEEIIERIPELTSEHIHHLSKTKAVGCPNFFIASDPVTDALILAIRGTASAADALTDCMCEEKDFLNAKAHGAISESTSELVKIARPILAEILEKAPNKKVVVTGHSLGAGTSVLATLSLFSKASADCLHDPDLVECYAFAPPPVFYPRAKLPEAPRIFSFVNNMDCIPRLCLGTGTKFCLAIKEVDSLDMSLSDRLKFLKAFPSEPKLPDFQEITDALMDKYHSHDPAGKVILLYPAADGKTNCEELTPDLTDRILLHKQMASDHSMKEYLRILEEVSCDTEIDASPSSRSARLPIHLQKLPASALKKIDEALALLQEAGLTEIASIESMRSSIAPKLQGTND